MKGIERFLRVSQTLEQSRPPRLQSTIAAQISAWAMELERIFDIRGRVDAGAGIVQCVVKLKR
jgi:hypothetical protein